jgi:hypothetical protein
MDTKALIRKLAHIFSESGAVKKYSQIWLSEIDLGGLYQSDKFILNLKAQEKIGRYLSELEFVSSLLRQKAKEELKFIMVVKVFGADEKIEPESDDYIIYEEEAAVS